MTLQSPQQQALDILVQVMDIWSVIDGATKSLHEMEWGFKRQFSDTEVRGGVDDWDIIHHGITTHVADVRRSIEHFFEFVRHCAKDGLVVSSHVLNSLRCMAENERANCKENFQTLMYHFGAHEGGQISNPVRDMLSIPDQFRQKLEEHKDVLKLEERPSGTREYVQKMEDLAGVIAENAKRMQPLLQEIYEQDLFKFLFEAPPERETLPEFINS